MCRFLLFIFIVALVCAQVHSHCIGPFRLLDTEEGESNVTFAKEGLKKLRSSEFANRPAIPIIVAGPSRKGKSFFLGMISGCRDKFRVGNMLEEQETMGANMVIWEPDGDSSNKKKPVFLLIDTEGLNNPQDIHDTALLTFAMMASSHVIYHQSERLEDSDLQQVSTIAQMVRVFRSKGNILPVKVPELTWVLEKCSTVTKMEPT